VGKNRAKELVFTGKNIRADKALEYGIANKVCAAESLMEEVLKTATLIAAKGKVALRAAKEVIQNGTAADLETGCRIENDGFGIAMVSEDAKEGTTAFLEKRKPVFKGELN
jgi:enoyl-CoA hydratase